MSERYVISADTTDRRLAGEVATALREWLADRDPSMPITQERANADAQDVEGSLLILLAVHATGHILGHAACSLLHKGIGIVQERYGVLIKAKPDGGQEGPATDVLPKPE